MTATISKDIRIGIIGAGPGGLSAAEALREKGYTNITILEKKNRVGGQSLSLSYTTQDNRKIVYELGSKQPVSSSPLFQLIKQYGVHIGKDRAKNNNNKTIYLKIYSCAQQKCLVDFSKYKLGFSISHFWPLLMDIIKLSWALIRYRKLAKIGYDLMPQERFNELAIPFEQWVDQQHFNLIDLPLKMLGIAGTFGNPKLKNELPAYIGFKFIFQCVKWPPTRLRYLDGSIQMIKEGYQELWNRIAKQHHVLLNTNLLKIIRKNNRIEVSLSDKKIIFDKLIVTCSLQQANCLLDVTDEERKLFSKIRYNSGWIVAFLAKNLPHDGIYFIKEHYLGKTHGCFSIFIPEGEVEDGVWLYTADITNNKNENIASLLKEAEKILCDEFHGKVIQWIKQVYWPECIPHCSQEDVQNGIYQRLEKLQGKNDTYYIGEALSGSMHATVVDYAYAKIKENF